MNVESVITKWHAGLVDPETGAGVAVQAEPACSCSSCLLEAREDRVTFDSEHAVLEMAPALLLPHEESVLPRFVLAAVRLDYDDSGLQRPLWALDGLSVADVESIVVELAAVLEGEVMGELWRRLEALVDELDREIA